MFLSISTNVTEDKWEVQPQRKHWSTNKHSTLNTLTLANIRQKMQPLDLKINDLLSYMQRNVYFLQLKSQTVFAACRCLTHLETYMTYISK